MPVGRGWQQRCCVNTQNGNRCLSPPPESRPPLPPAAACPFLGLMLGLRQLGDVGCSVFERDELAAAGQRNGLVERSFPARGFFTEFVPLREAETRDTCTSTCPARACRAVSE